MTNTILANIVQGTSIWADLKPSGLIAINVVPAQINTSSSPQNVIRATIKDQGPIGPIGLPNTLSIGTVVGGTVADATITGTSPTQTLNLTLPKGEDSIVPGPDGLSAYEVAVAGGYSDTEVNWLLSLVGTNGSNGTNGTNGVGITSVVKTSTLGLVDTYTVTYTDSTTDTFDVTNGAAGTNGTNGTNGVGVPTGGTTGQVLKKKSNTNYDTEFGDLVAVSVTTKGDLQTFNATTPDRLPVGTDGQILESRASETTGLKWIASPTIPVKSSAAETDAVTDDAKFVTSLTARKFTAAPASDHLASGNKVVLNANEAQAFGDVCYIDADGQAHLGDADAIATSSCVVMCADATIAANADGNYLLLGFARDDIWAWAVGGLIYLTVTGTSGNTLSQTAPTGPDDVVQVMGIATATTRMYFKPSLIQVELV